MLLASCDSNDALKNIENPNPTVIVDELYSGDNYAIAGVNLRLARITGRAPMLTPAKLRELRHPDRVVDNQTMAATGWIPKINLQQGLEALRNSAL